jgi:hypothetical protein
VPSQGLVIEANPAASINHTWRQATMPFRETEKAMLASLRPACDTRSK